MPGPQSGHRPTGLCLPPYRPGRSGHWKAVRERKREVVRGVYVEKERRNTFNLEFGNIYILEWNQKEKQRVIDS